MVAYCNADIAFLYSIDHNLTSSWAVFLLLALSVTVTQTFDIQRVH